MSLDAAIIQGRDACGLDARDLDHGSQSCVIGLTSANPRGAIDIGDKNLAGVTDLALLVLILTIALDDTVDMDWQEPRLRSGPLEGVAAYSVPR